MTIRSLKLYLKLMGNTVLLGNTTELQDDPRNNLENLSLSELYNLLSDLLQEAVHNNCQHLSVRAVASDVEDIDNLRRALAILPPSMTLDLDLSIELGDDHILDNAFEYNAATINSLLLALHPEIQLHALDISGHDLSDLAEFADDDQEDDGLLETLGSHSELMMLNMDSTGLHSGNLEGLVYCIANFSDLIILSLSHNNLCENLLDAAEGEVRSSYPDCLQFLTELEPYFSSGIVILEDNNFTLEQSREIRERFHYVRIESLNSLEDPLAVENIETDNVDVLAPRITTTTGPDQDSVQQHTSDTTIIQSTSTNRTDGGNIDAMASAVDSFRSPEVMVESIDEDTVATDTHVEEEKVTEIISGAVNPTIIESSEVQLSSDNIASHLDSSISNPTLGAAMEEIEEELGINTAMEGIALEEETNSQVPTVSRTSTVGFPAELSSRSSSQLAQMPATCTTAAVEHLTSEEARDHTANCSFTLQTEAKIQGKIN